MATIIEELTKRTLVPGMRQVKGHVRDESTREKEFRLPPTQVTTAWTAL